MKKIVLFLFFTSFLLAHTLLVQVINNEDNTITIKGEFNTGEDAAGALLKLESLISDEILFSQRLPQESEITLKIPLEPYQIILDAGPGHIVVKKGVEPLEGFSEELKEKAKRHKASKNSLNIESAYLTNIFLILCFIMFVLSLYFSNKNTNKILRQLKEN